jgi:hypothetical protein
MLMYGTISMHKIKEEHMIRSILPQPHLFPALHFTDAQLLFQTPHASVTADHGWQRCVVRLYSVCRQQEALSTSDHVTLVISQLGLA